MNNFQILINKNISGNCKNRCHKYHRYNFNFLFRF